MKFHIKSNQAGLTALYMFALVCAGHSYAQTDRDEGPAQSSISGFATVGGTYHNNPDVGIIFSGAQSKPAYQGLSAVLDSV